MAMSLRESKGNNNSIMKLDMGVVSGGSQKVLTAVVVRQ